MSLEDAARIEFTLHNPYPTRAQIETFCGEARASACRAVLVPGSRVIDACHFLEESSVRICATIGFPFGASDSDVKRYEAEVAIDAGAHELELLCAIGRLREGDYKSVMREIRDVVESADERPVKAVIEATLWSEPQLAEIVAMVLDSGAQYLVLTSSPLSADNTALIARCRALAGPEFGLKAAAHNAAAVREMLAAGANVVALNPPVHTKPRAAEPGTREPPTSNF